MTSWNDPRLSPVATFAGPPRPFGSAEAELAPVISAIKHGRFYEVEAWVASGRPLQLAPDAPRSRRAETLLAVAIKLGGHDLVHLLICDGYRPELEPRSPLDAALEIRRWDILDLLLAWGADPAGADVSIVLGSYERTVFERFWAAGVDLTAGDALAYDLAYSSRNRPLYGFARASRETDARIQRALDVALVAAIWEKNYRAAGLCIWAGADPRRRVAEVGEGAEEDANGLTAIEASIENDAHDFVRRFRVDRARDDGWPPAGPWRSGASPQT